MGIDREIREAFDGISVPAKNIALRKASNEIARLREAIRRIDAINDSPSRFNSEINAVCDRILRPELLAVRG